MSATDTYTIYRITTLEAGLAHLEIETNDDNDDGYVDEDVIFWKRNMTMAQALEMAGKSRRGYYGQPVDVYVDSEKI